MNDLEKTPNNVEQHEAKPSDAERIIAAMMDMWRTDEITVNLEEVERVQGGVRSYFDPTRLQWIIRRTH